MGMLKLSGVIGMEIYWQLLSISGVTGKAFGLYVIYGESHLTFDCYSNNVVYLMTCSICIKQYVGQTK